jgi:hypothetical protein
LNCEEARGQIHAFWDGTLGPEDHERMQLHLEICVDCADGRDRIGRLAELLKEAVRVPEAPLVSWAEQKVRILAALEGSAPREQRRGLGRPFLKVALVAAAALAAAIGFLLWKAASPPRAPVDVAQKPSPVAPASRLPEAVPAPPEAPTPVSPVPPSAPAEALPSVTVAALLPGSPEHLKQMADEAVDVGLAETATERVLVFLGAADSRLQELRRVMGKDDAMAAALAKAYILLLREGIAPVLRDREESPENLRVAQRIAHTRARKQEDSLSQLGGSASGTLKVTLTEAIEASRELAKP